jgi:transcriptional regulator GlxA family with amidase domain
MQWVMRARVDVARELLERSTRSVEQIAAEAGLGTGSNLRLHFQRILGTTPSQYRRTFSSEAGSSSSSSEAGSGEDLA